MDYFGRLAAKNSFGDITGGKKMNTINIICGVLLIVLIIILIVSLMNNNNDNFDNEDDTHIYLITRPGCRFAKRASDLFKENGMKLNGHNVKEIDIEDTKKHIGKELASKVNGTPTLVCISTGKMSVGLKKSLEEYAKELGLSNDTDDNNNSNENNSSDGSNLKNGHIVLVGRDSCPFCIRAKALMDEVLGKDTYKFLDSNTHEAKSILAEKEMNGVPLILCNKTGKVIKGFNEPEIKKLK
jgi:glutaredoxin